MRAADFLDETDVNELGGQDGQKPPAPSGTIAPRQSAAAFLDAKDRPPKAKRPARPSAAAFLNAAEDSAAPANVLRPGAVIEGPNFAQRAAVAAEPYVVPALKTVEAVGAGYPVLEAGANLATGAAAMPVAGIAGLVAKAAQAAGYDVDPAAVVAKVNEALTYQPRTELGKHLTGAVTYPLEKLAEAGKWAGEKTQDLGGNPAAATAVETAVNVAPFVVPGLVKGARVPRSRVIEGEARPVEEPPAQRIETRPPAPEEPTAPTAPPQTPKAGEDRRTDSARRARVGELIDRARERLAKTLAPDLAEKVARVEALEAEANTDPLTGVANRRGDAGDTRQALAEHEPGTRVVRYRVDLDNFKALNDAFGHDSGDAALKAVAESLREALRAEDVATIARVGGDEFAVTLRAGEHGGDPAVIRDRMEAAVSKKLGELGFAEVDGKSVGASIGYAVHETGMDAAALDKAADRAAMQRKEERGTSKPRSAPVPAGTVRSAAVFLDEPVSGASTTAEADFGALRQARRREAAPAGRQALYSTTGEVAGAGPARDVPSIEHGSSGEPPAGPAASRMAMAPGSGHVGFIDDTTLPRAERATKPIRREDVLAPFLKALGVRVYEGRVRSGTTMGFYLPKREAVRIKNASDLETTAHEIAHLLDDRVFNGFGREQGMPRRRPWIVEPDAKTYANELRGVSYDRHKPYEGFAEFVRLWMTQPEKARAAAPNFSRWFDGFVQDSKYGPALLEARRGMTEWFGQDALSRARSKIGEQRGINRLLDRVGDKFRQATVDDLHGIYRMERELTGQTAPLGSYETARLTRASGSMTEGALRYGYPAVKADGSFEFRGKGLEQILEPVSDRLDDFLLYAVGRSARELRQQGREHLFTPGEIDAMVGLGRPDFRKAFEQYQEWNHGVLDFAEALGLINPEARALWRRAEYLPFHRVGAATERARGGVAGNWHGIKALTGGSENIRDVLDNVIGNAHMLIDAALKNQARAKVAELADSRRGGGRFMTPIPPESRLVKIDKEQLRDKLLEAAGADIREPNPAIESTVDRLLAQAPAFVDFLVKGQAPAGGNVIAVLKRGKPHYYEVADPILYRAIVALNRPARNVIVKWLGLPKRIGQLSITATFDFAFGNIVRDSIMASIVSRAGFRPAVDSIRGLAARVTRDASYRDWLANGGGFSSHYMDENAFRAHLARFYARKGIDARTVLDAPAKFLYFMESFFDAFEAATRLGEFGRARARGEHPRHAAYLAREVSTDFAQRGDSQLLGFFYDTVMFLKPATVSLDRLYRGIAHDPNRGAIAAKTAALALASTTLYLYNRQKPQYQQLEDWDRDAYWHFFIPTSTGEDLHFRLPKTWEVGAVASLAERSAERIVEDAPARLAGDFARIAGQQLSWNLLPQAIAPAYELATNRDSFTGRPIETEGMARLQPFLRARPGTSETMRQLGMATRKLPESMQISPARAEHVLRGYLGTWAMYGLLLSDEALFRERLPERRLDQYPVVRRFYREEPPLNTKAESDFYEMLDEARKLKSTVRALEKQGQGEAAQELTQDPRLEAAAPLERVSRALSRLRAQGLAIRDSDLSPAEKRRRLDDIARQRNEWLESAVQSVEPASRSPQRQAR